MLTGSSRAVSGEPECRSCKPGSHRRAETRAKEFPTAVRDLASHTRSGLLQRALPWRIAISRTGSMAFRFFGLAPEHQTNGSGAVPPLPSSLTTAREMAMKNLWSSRISGRPFSTAINKKPFGQPEQGPVPQDAHDQPHHQLNHSQFCPPDEPDLS